MKRKQRERILIDKLRSGEFIELKSKGNKKTAHLFYGITKFNITNDSYKKSSEIISVS